MQNKAPILTIAIPTYNRSNYLARLLESLRPQMEEANHLFSIELLVSDNASTDLTSEVVEAFCRSCIVPCRTFRNKTNLGADLLRNFRRGAVVTTPLVAASSDARGGYALFTVFGTNLKSIGEEWLVEPRLVQIVVNGTLQVFFPPFVLGTRQESNAFSEEQSFFPLFRQRPLSDIRLSTFPSSQRSGALLASLDSRHHRLDKALGNPMLR